MIHNILKDTKVVLASESPRRKLILEMLGLKPLVIPAKIDEPLSAMLVYKQAMMHARAKTDAVARFLDDDALIIGSDTIVCVDHQNLGKPSGKDQAAIYLRMLSGRSHSVYTGVSMRYRNQVLTAYERSTVTFKQLSEAEIAAYILTKEPFDKAGAYGIQGFGAQFISKIQGCYFNVMGFPVNLFYRMLGELMHE